jgi:hypothetical protein
MRWLTVERTVIIVLFVLIFALAFRVPVDTDTWWHLRSGDTILQHGFIYNDPFSSTMQGSPWIDHSWGAQVLLATIWNAGSYAGLAMFMAGLATAGMAFVYLMCAGNAYLRAFAVVLGAATAAVFWSPRPQMISFFLSAVILFILVRYKRGGRDYLWFIPLIMILWGNLHAGFSIGFIFIAALIAGEALGNVFAPNREQAVSWRGIRKLIFVGVVSVGALCINPYGLQMLTVPFQTVNIGALQNFIQEWNSPNFHERQTLPFLALLFLTFGVVGASRNKLDWTDFILYSGTGYLALNAGRNIAVFAVAVTPIFTVYLNSALTERGWVLRPSRRVSSIGALVNASIIFGVCIGAGVKIAAVLSPPLVTQALAETLPVEAVQALNERAAAGNLFNSYNWGGYLTYFAPEYPVFVDGRTDLYGDTFLSNDYLDTALAREGWQATLERYGVNTVLIETNGSLARALHEDSAWQVAYEDDLATLFVRQTPIVSEAENG